MVQPAAASVRGHVPPARGGMRVPTGIAPSWSYEQLVDELAGRFDRNRDGSISLDATQGARLLGEAFCVRTSRHARPAGGVDVLHEVVSIERLVRMAEGLGVDDGVATSDELVRCIASFDANGDGRIDLGEHGAAIARCGERTVFRWVEHLPRAWGRA